MLRARVFTIPPDMASSDRLDDVAAAIQGQYEEERRLEPDILAYDKRIFGETYINITKPDNGQRGILVVAFELEH